MSKPGAACLDNDLGAELVASLHQHRIETTHQLHELHAPHLTERRVLQVLADLERQRFVCRYQPSRRVPACWFLSSDGYRAMDRVGERRQHRMTSVTARAGLRLHTLSLNTLGCAFVTVARARGDECDWTAWRHESIVARKALSGRDLIADATLDYRLADGTALTWWVELDRGTTSAATLIDKIVGYAKVAATQRRFAPVLVVGATMDAAAWDRRWRWVDQEACRTTAVRTAERLQVLSAYLPDLVDHGPWASIWTRLGMSHVRWTCWNGLPLSGR